MDQNGVWMPHCKSSRLELLCCQQCNDFPAVTTSYWEKRKCQPMNNSSQCYVGTRDSFHTESHGRTYLNLVDCCFSDVFHLKREDVISQIRDDIGRRMWSQTSKVNKELEKKQNVNRSQAVALHPVEETVEWKLRFHTRVSYESQTRNEYLVPRTRMNSERVKRHF